MDKKMDNSLFFLTLCFVCVWLVVDVAAGKDYLGNFLSIIFPGLYEKKGTPVYVDGEYVGTDKGSGVYDDNGTYLGIYNTETGKWDRGEFNGSGGFGGQNQAPNSSATGQGDGSIENPVSGVPYGATR